MIGDLFIFINAFLKHDRKDIALIFLILRIDKSFNTPANGFSLSAYLEKWNKLTSQLS